MENLLWIAPRVVGAAAAVAGSTVVLPAAAVGVLGLVGFSAAGPVAG